jgi:hypothetical protein
MTGSAYSEREKSHFLRCGSERKSYDPQEWPTRHPPDPPPYRASRQPALIPLASIPAAAARPGSPPSCRSVAPGSPGAGSGRRPARFTGHSRHRGRQGRHRRLHLDDQLRRGHPVRDDARDDRHVADDGYLCRRPPKGLVFRRGSCPAASVSRRVVSYGVRAGPPTDAPASEVTRSRATRSEGTLPEGTRSEETLSGGTMSNSATSDPGAVAADVVVA